MPPFDPRGYIGAFNPPLPGSSPIAKDTRKLQIDDVLARLAGAEEFDRVRFQQGEQTGRQKIVAQSALDVEAERAKNAREAARVLAGSPGERADIRQTNARSIADLIAAGVEFGPVPMVAPGQTPAQWPAPAKVIDDPSPSLGAILDRAPKKWGIPTAVRAAAATVKKESAYEITRSSQEMNGVPVGGLVDVVEKWRNSVKTEGGDPNLATPPTEVQKASEQLEDHRLLTQGVYDDYNGAKPYNIRDTQDGKGYYFFIEGQTGGHIITKADLRAGPVEDDLTTAAGDDLTTNATSTVTATPHPFAGASTGESLLDIGQGPQSVRGSGPVKPSFTLPQISIPTQRRTRLPR